MQDDKTLGEEWKKLRGEDNSFGAANFGLTIRPSLCFLEQEGRGPPKPAAHVVIPPGMATCLA